MFWESNHYSLIKLANYGLACEKIVIQSSNKSRLYNKECEWGTGL